MVSIRKVDTAAGLRRFINFPETLYGDSSCYVPKLIFDQKGTLSPNRNPASEFCDSQLYLAYKDGRIAGRVAAIVNHRANEHWNHREVRFGWFDFIDDREVSSALLAEVEKFGRERGMDCIVGPLGFTDFDPEGMLVEGFDKEGTMALIYNHPYYREHIESFGFEKDVDWIEYRIKVPEALPERIVRTAEIVRDRMKVENVPISRSMMRSPEFSHGIFNLINLCYKDLYNFTILPEHLADKYIGFYVKLLGKEYLSVVRNEKGEFIAFGIMMPSLTRALQKCRGKLFPFGWMHLLRAMYGRRNEGIELLLVGVRPDYRNSGVNSLLFTDLFNKISPLGKKWAESNAVLEDNFRNMSQWRDFELEFGKRRRSYIKKLSSNG